MSVRYIFNTSGEYVAFVQGTNLFSPDAEWLGFIRGTNVFAPDGSFLGLLLSDDRIGRPTAGSKPPSIFPPFAPFKPFVPFRPLSRLKMPPLPAGWEDVFERGAQPRLSREQVASLNHLLDSRLHAGDGTFLGLVSKNKLLGDSLTNRFGRYGNRYSSESIFNPYSPYGSKYGPYSPFNPHSSAPPTFLKQGKQLGKLSVNRFIQDRIDPEQFLAWLGSNA